MVLSINKPSWILFGFLVKFVKLMFAKGEPFPMLLLILLQSSILLLLAENLPIEDFISREQVIKNIDNYRKKMPEKIGYKGSKTWSVIVEYTAKKKDNALFNSLMSVRPVTPEKNSEYRKDIFQLMKLDPSFFLKQFDQYFDGEKKCLEWFFDREQYSLKDLNFSDIKNDRIRKLNNTNKLKEDIARKCYKIRNKKIRQHFQIQKT